MFLVMNVQILKQIVFHVILVMYYKIINVFSVKIKTVFNVNQHLTVRIVL